MTQELRTFLTFQAGAATGALDLYRDVLDDFELIEIDHYGPEDAGPRGNVKVARFRLASSDFSYADSPSFTNGGSRLPCHSGSTATIRVNSSVSSVNSAMGASCSCLSTTTGSVLGFGWVGDRYGVTWQLNVP
jgi:predicted 3-demethylubiquinone-9 3-methyltransferase (glyoxalase superfamily)